MGSDNLQSKYKQFERLYIYFSYKIFINKLFIWMIPTDSKLYYLIRKILLHRVCRHMLALCYCALDLATIPSGFHESIFSRIWCLKTVGGFANGKSDMTKIWYKIQKLQKNKFITNFLYYFRINVAWPLAIFKIRKCWVCW